MTIAFKKISSTNRDVTQVQENVDAVFKQLRLNPLADALIIPNVVFSGTTPKIINHMLDRQPVGWFIIDRTDDALIHRTAWSPKTLTLVSTATTTVSIMVF
jgi:hypothetical protein